MKKRSYWNWLFSLQVLLFLAAGFPVSASGKQTIYTSSYVTFSPDQKAWTTNPGDADYTWYPAGTTVSTGIRSSIRELQTGEHYYKTERMGEVPVGYWKVMHRPAQCIHEGYPAEENYHDIVYGRKKCLGHYYSGWMAYCADCGENITGMYMYMSREAAESIDYLQLTMKNGIPYEYYYLCPHCNNLEQGSELKAHLCKAISWNRYVVRYDANVGTYGGFMSDSFHMYNNATEYDGEPVTPVTHLTKNSYTRIGYEFVEWNTRADGSGTAYADGEEILNLTTENMEDGTATGQGIVKLYAQWRPSQSTLRLEANGGTYNGQPQYTVTKEYNTEYSIREELLQVPNGYTVSFETNGGGAVSSVISTKYFKEWRMEQPFAGRMKNSTYYFLAGDGHTDTLTALYEPDSITLPAASREGYSFGGWYYDNEFAKPAGGAGDTITPSKDLTLYAQWVDLKLTAENNYAANDGKGAVDLSWTQSDGRNKTYQIYQSRDACHWTQVSDAADIGSSRSVKEEDAYSGSERTYTVPYTGLYTLTASGAQGGSYGSYAGGAGGSVEADFWLNRGEILTYNIGSDTGYNGGGKASSYGCGGGRTTVSSNLKGTLLIAGGGGGASPAGNGGAGGSSASIGADGSGQNGMAGGGAGYRGGSAGERIVHHHTETCYYRQDQAYSLLRSAWWKAYRGRGAAPGQAEGPAVHFWGNGVHTAAYDVQGATAHIDGGQFEYHMGKYYNGTYGVTDSSWTAGGIPANNNTSVDIGLYFHAWAGCDALGAPGSKIVVYDQNGKTIYSGTMEAGRTENYRNGNYSSVSVNPSGQPGLTGHCESSSNVPHTVRTIEGTINVPLPKGTTGIYISLYRPLWGGNNGAWVTCRVESVEFKGGRKENIICGYTEGQVISSKPAYGGSNYVNTEYAYRYGSNAGQRKGNGTFSIQSETIGFVDALQLSGVMATDYAAPWPVDAALAVLEPVGRVGTGITDAGGGVIVRWEEPADRGTDYYHYVESCLIGSGTSLCRSNITKNTLTSGIRGYYVAIDTEAVTTVTAGNGKFQRERQLAVNLAEASDSRRYLHIAAVDVAGNISETVHISVGRDDVAWNLYTKQLEIEEGDNVYPAAGQDKTWYVRADGSTPFTMQHYAFMEGPATKNYQVNYTIFETQTASGLARNIIFTPNHEISAGNIITAAEELTYTTEGSTLLGQYPFILTERSNLNRDMHTTQMFTLSRTAHGKVMDVLPRTGAARTTAIQYSDPEADRENGIRIIGDGEAPVIIGTENLENLKLINREEKTVEVRLSAEDDLSGVREFYLEVYNVDNVSRKTCFPGENGEILLNITQEDPIFTGDFGITLYAVDNVGNVRVQRYDTTEFALQTRLERILEPHDPVFQRGESGILTITAYGYIDRIVVEFPKEIEEERKYSTEYIYEDPEYISEEKIQFMVPLYAKEKEDYRVRVTAYKNGEKLVSNEPLMVVAGTVLDDFRTRIR